MVNKPRHNQKTPLECMQNLYEPAVLVVRHHKGFPLGATRVTQKRILVFFSGELHPPTQRTQKSQRKGLEGIGGTRTSEPECFTNDEGPLCSGPSGAALFLPKTVFTKAGFLIIIRIWDHEK